MVCFRANDMHVCTETDSAVMDRNDVDHVVSGLLDFVCILCKKLQFYPVRCKTV